MHICSIFVGLPEIYLHRYFPIKCLFGKPNLSAKDSAILQVYAKEWNLCDKVFSFVDPAHINAQFVFNIYCKLLPYSHFV